MSKKLFLFSLVSLCFFRSFSQTIIAGKIVDSSDIGIPYADILLLDEEGNWTNELLLMKMETLNYLPRKMEYLKSQS